MPKLSIAAADMLAPAIPNPAEHPVQAWRDYDGRIWAYVFTLEGQHWMHVPDLASFRFGGDVDCVTVIPQPPIRAQLIRDVFLRNVLPMALQAVNTEVLHASAVRAHHGVIAFCGFSEAGKSTVAFGLSRRGYPLWADDAIPFETSGGPVRAIPVPFKIRLRPASASFFGKDHAMGQVPSGWDGADQAEMEPAPLAALCLLKQLRAEQRDGRAVECLWLPPAQAFRAVLEHAYCCFGLEDVERKRSMMKHYLDLAARVPVCEVRFQPGLDNLSEILDGIEQDVFSALAESA